MVVLLPTMIVFLPSSTPIPEPPRKTPTGLA
jgi:hypothetical protein